MSWMGSSESSRRTVADLESTLLMWLDSNISIFPLEHMSTMPAEALVMHCLSRSAGLCVCGCGAAVAQIVLKKRGACAADA